MIRFFSRRGLWDDFLTYLRGLNTWTDFQGRQLELTSWTQRKAEYTGPGETAITVTMYFMPRETASRRPGRPHL